MENKVRLVPTPEAVYFTADLEASAAMKVQRHCKNMLWNIHPAN